MSAILENDALLVARSVAGNRSAFEQIVVRYQSLVCAVAYSAVGNLHRSEDVAQETFLMAWRQMRNLREPERLRAWLCGIARNVARNLHHRDRHEPASGGLPVEEVAELSDEAETTLLDIAISDEEQAILWRSIGALPSAYREALVLFYREQHSTEQVARALGLTDDAARQRLSRGRKLLHGEVIALVERTLKRSAPGKAFTSMVIAALPATTMLTATTATAASLGATKGSVMAKSGVAAYFLGLAGPLIGAVSIWFGVRAELDAAPTAREKALVVRHTISMIGGTLLFVAALYLLVFQGPRIGDHPAIVLALGAVLGLGFGGWIVVALLRGMRNVRALRAETNGPAHCREFRSASTLLGWPLYHIRFGTPPVDAPMVRAWIAIGDRSIGLVFAMGHLAIAPISVGIVAVGGLSVGGVAVGLLPIASVALGALPLGGAAFGLLAIGGFAAGWFGAVGGLALSVAHAAGGFAIAPHANDAVAFAWLSAWLPLGFLPTLIVTLAILAIVPSMLFAIFQRRYLAGLLK